ncbi:Hypothetical predicted protein [Cloeon dipterum]|uniref:Uncharacterized protein n=1 Tax=Cloeon dipterum TaxID=197152 RepID=A0A8S1DM37_9INSE|nr:Hypothetical predicted protein [Cloeon dipterum]
MGKAQFHDRFLFVLLTATAFLLSGIASTKADDEIKEEKGNDFYDTDEYNSMKIHYANYPDEESDSLWKNMEIEENATELTEDLFVDGKALIYLPFGIKLFDLNVTQVAVTKQGTIQLQYPSVNWTIAPLNAEHGETRCNISYLFQDKNFYVQWNNFRFNYKNFKEHELSFQVRLSDGGEIEFVYQEVPYNLKALRENCDCLGEKFGVTFYHREFFKVFPYQDIYELGYLLDFDKYEVKKGTVIRFATADECMFRTNCYACTETEFHFNENETARCLWCPAMQKCSSTRDSFRHLWREKRCDINYANDRNGCDFLNDPRMTIYYLIVYFSTVLLLVTSLVIICCLQDRPCIASPWARLRGLFQSTNQPNQLDANNPAENQNNEQEDQDEQGDQEVPDVGVNNPVQIQATYVQEEPGTVVLTPSIVV